MPVPIVGYVNRFSAKPGGQFEVKVSSTFAEPYEARLVRIRAADPNPAGPGQKIINLGEVFKQSFPHAFNLWRSGRLRALRIPITSREAMPR